MDCTRRPSGHPAVSTDRAVVLGGGGLAGIAWHAGMLLGMSEGGLDVDDADLFVGTSAGATVAAQVAGGLALEECFARQVDPDLQNHELRPTGMTVADLWDTMVQLFEEVDDPAERRRRVAAMAVASATVPESVRRAVVAGRLPSHEWPTTRLAVVAVDVATGDRRVFESGSGAGLVDAVAASSAVPGIWPPVTIGGRRYVDGGVYSLANVDLAVGYRRVLVLAPMVDPDLTLQVAALGESGRAVVVSPDHDSLAAFGADALDPAVRAPSARAGRRQGVAAADTLSELWTATPDAGPTIPTGPPSE